MYVFKEVNSVKWFFYNQQLFFNCSFLPYYNANSSKVCNLFKMKDKSQDIDKHNEAMDILSTLQESYPGKMLILDSNQEEESNSNQSKKNNKQNSK